MLGLDWDYCIEIFISCVLVDCSMSVGEETSETGAVEEKGEEMPETDPERVAAKEKDKKVMSENDPVPMKESDEMMMVDSGARCATLERVGWRFQRLQLGS